MKLQKTDFLKLGEKLLAGVALALPLVSFADLPSAPCSAFTGLNCQSGDLAGLIITVINWLLAFAGLIAILFIIYGGFRYITSAGNEESSEAGKKSIVNALIGLVVIIMAYVLVSVVNTTISRGPSVTGP